ncbi:unnamed protein product [Rangifer tarandus platyrhynchus]|uniref:Uncharacterized protein n=1 Tax=Rangifer tarandus platyrhynchus TaxID=3082113 RepID=A0AC59ZRF5_RANTA
MGTTSLSIPLSMNRHLGCFSVLATVNSAAVNTDVCVCVCVCVCVQNAHTGSLAEIFLGGNLRCSKKVTDELKTFILFTIYLGFPDNSVVKNLLVMQETQETRVRFLG